MGLFSKSKTKPFLQEIEDRRTIYSTETTISISDKELEDMIEHIIKYTPSAFNSQSTRIVLLLNDQHHKFWDNTKTVLKDVMVPDRDFTQLNNVSTDLNMHMAQFFISKTKMLLKVYKNKCQIMLITLLIGQFKQTQCINLQFGLH